MATFIEHGSSGHLYVVTSGTFGSESWKAAPIGMADVSDGMNYQGTLSFHEVTNPRTLEAWRIKMVRIGRPECAAIIESSSHGEPPQHDGAWHLVLQHDTVGS